MHHLPYGATWDKRGYIRPAPSQEFDIVLCGHVHQHWFVNSLNCINVGVDKSNFYPQTLDELLEKAKIEEKFPADKKLTT